MGIFLNFIASPEETIHKISRKDLGYSSFLILILAYISSTGGFALFCGIPSNVLIYSLTWGLVIKLILSVFGILLITALYHYFAGVFGGNGNPVRLFKALPYSFIPYCFVAPIILILKAFAGGAEWIIWPIFVLLVFWMARLQLKIINYFYGLTVVNSFVVFILPWIIIAGLTTLVPMILGISILMFIL